MRSKNEENEAYLSEIEVGCFYLGGMEFFFLHITMLFFVYCCLDDFHADYWTSI